MRLGAPMTLGLGGKRRTSDPNAALKASLSPFFDNAWLAADYNTDTDTWVDFIDNRPVTGVGVTKVATGGTYTDVGAVVRTATRSIVYLDGSASYIDFTDTIPLGTGNNASIVVGIKPRSLVANGVVIAQKDGTANASLGFYMMALSTGALRTNIADGTNFVNAATGAGLLVAGTDALAVSIITGRSTVQPIVQPRGSSRAGASTSIAAVTGTATSTNKARVGTYPTSPTTSQFEAEVFFIGVKSGLISLTGPDDLATIATALECGAAD